MKVETLKCSNCGSNLEVNENREFIFCKYCGTKNFINDEIKVKQNITYHINEAQKSDYDEDIKRLEYEKLLREKEEYKRNHRSWITKLFIKLFKIAVVLGIIYFVLFVLF